MPSESPLVPQGKQGTCPAVSPKPRDKLPRPIMENYDE